MQEFIRTRGVTHCPPTGSKELIQRNIERSRAEEESAKANHWRKRKAARLSAAVTS